MRFVRRNRLVVVVALAVGLGAALPWIELFLPSGQLRSGNWVRNGQYSVRHDSTWDSHFTAVVTSSDASPAELIAIKQECYGLFPQIAEMPANSALNCRLYGWPFRALYEGELISANQHTQLAPASVELPDLGWLSRYMPYEIPIGILWRGMFGNIALAVLIFGGGYLLASYWRARRRSARGQCIWCGYQANHVAVCPECGAKH